MSSKLLSSSKMSSGRPAAISSGPSLTSLTQQQRTYFGFAFSNMHHWKLPYNAPDTEVKKEELYAHRYFKTKSRDQWDYNRVDDTVNGFSEFRNTSHRPEFSGLREESVLHDTHTPSHYRLMDHFDEYTKPGSDRKYQAACAVKEQWDSDESYYPGEQWKRNRPGFRSVPKELLNRQTWYHWQDFLTKWDEISPTVRTRSWNPNWPPQGLKPPKFGTSKREFLFGGDDPTLMAEVDRFAWYNASYDANVRIGPQELILTLVFTVVWWWENKIRNRPVMFKSQMNGMWYPGRIGIIDPAGCIRNTSEKYEWQLPLSELGAQGEVWFNTQSRFGYQNYLRRRDERERIEAAL